MSNVILWAGGEDFDYSGMSGGMAVDTTSTHFRSGYARCAISGSTKNSSVATVNNGFSASEFWWTARIWNTATSPSGSGAPLIQFLDSSGLPRILIQQANFELNSGSAWTVYTVNSSGTTTQIGSAFTIGISNAPSVPDKIDVCMNYGTSGQISVYINGALAYTYSGNITTNSVTSLAGFAVWGTIGTVAWSEVIVSTNDTRSMSLITVPPAGNGGTQQWTGNYADVDPVTLNDSNTVYTGTASEIEEFTTATALPSGNGGIVGVMVAARAMTSTGAPQHVELGLNIGGTDYFSSSISLQSSMSRVVNDWELNPATSAAWTAAELGSGDVGISLQSVA